jgi:hypothetical protein
MKSPVRSSIGAAVHPDHSPLSTQPLTISDHRTIFETYPIAQDEAVVDRIPFCHSSPKKGWLYESPTMMSGSVKSLDALSLHA